MINPYELVLLEDEMAAIILGTTTFIQITASASNKSQQVNLRWNADLSNPLTWCATLLSTDLILLLLERGDWPLVSWWWWSLSADGTTCVLCLLNNNLVQNLVHLICFLWIWCDGRGKRDAEWQLLVDDDNLAKDWRAHKPVKMDKVVYCFGFTSRHHDYCSSICYCQSKYSPSQQHWPYYISLLFA